MRAVDYARVRSFTNVYNYEINTHRKGLNMKSLKVRKQFILDSSKIKKAQKLLKARTETETIERALDDLLIADEIARQLKKMAGKFDIENMDQSSFRE